MSAITKIYASTVNLITTGAAPGNASLSNNTITTTASVKVTSSNSLDYPLGEFELNYTPAGAVTAGTTIDLYVRDYDIANANATPSPTTSYFVKFVGSFFPTGSAAQYLKLDGVPLPKNCDFFVYNNGTGQAMNSNWTLNLRPYTYG